MRIEKSVMGDVVLFKISGAITFNDVHTLRTNLKRVTKEGKHYIVVDCTDMDSINSQALASFLSVYKSIQDKGGVAFANVNTHVQRIFNSTHLDDLFQIYPSVTEAVEGVKLQNN